MMDVLNWKSQLKRGLLEYSLLLFIQSKKRVYGLEMIEGVNAAGMEISEGTIYPLLARLTREGMLKPQWETENNTGHPRKYYSLSAKGEQVLNNMSTAWEQTVQTILKLKEEQTL